MRSLRSFSLPKTRASAPRSRTGSSNSASTFRCSMQGSVPVASSYRDDVATGRLEWSRTGAGGEHQSVVLVPDDYDPVKRYRVCFYLHGGVNRADRPKKGDRWWRRFDRFDSVDQISVFPASWRGSLWWQPRQIENLEAILDRLETLYNVDENQVFLYGVSDGGSGVYYFAMKASTRWAGYFPFIGHPSVLSNPRTGVIGEMFEGNLVNKPLYIVNVKPIACTRQQGCGRMWKRFANRARRSCSALSRAGTTHAGGTASRRASKRSWTSTLATHFRSECRGRPKTRTDSADSRGS